MFFIRCAEDKDTTGVGLKGTWDAHWELSDHELSTLFSSDQMKMDGKISFIDENVVTIKVFGFSGCAFTTDTSYNRMYYQINDSLLVLMNNPDEVVFSYKIIEQKPDFISMKLMDDIYLTLNK